jgi:drug/metabolite transporter (DMT)-like permease
LVDKAPWADQFGEMPAPDSSSTPYSPLAIGLILLSTMVFATGDGLAKTLSGHLPAIQINFLRNAVVAAITLPVVFALRGAAAFRTRHPWRQFLRGMAVFLASVLFISGLAHLQLAENSAINYIWPVLTTLFSFLLLKESIGIRRLLATLAGFVGMLIMVRPGTEAFNWAAIFPFMAAVVWALSTIMTRSMAQDEAPETTIVWSSIIALLASALIVPFGWAPMTWSDFGVASMMGLGSAFGHAMVIFAFGMAPASALAPYTYVQLVWAGALGYLMFGQLPDRYVVLGCIIIVAAGIYTAHREHVRNRDKVA